MMYEELVMQTLAGMRSAQSKLFFGGRKHMRLSKRKMALRLSVALACAAGAQSLLADSTDLTQTNLTSDVPGLAQHLDPNLKNPWGISFATASPFWVSNQGSGNTTLYNATGKPQSLIVATPPGSPTGQVFNGTGQFLAPNGNASLFIFATLAGTIDAWNGGLGTTAATVVPSSGAVYTGLALGNNGSANFLYAANAVGGINVFDSNFHATTLSGSFTDPNLPAGYTPYNIQNIGGKLLVAYTQGFATGNGIGVVDEFDTNGNFTKRLITGGPLNAPWGFALAPTGFAHFGGDLLVGNFGNGEINAFDPTSGAFVGTLDDPHGNPIVNEGLWGLAFRTAPGFNPNSLYFTAGINGQKDGLFGTITPTPEPATFAIAALGLVAALFLKRARA